MRWHVLVLAGLVVTSVARAETIGEPHLMAGDTWVYQQTIEDKTGWHETRLRSSVERVGPATLALSVNDVGSTMPAREQLVGIDWSRTRSVNGRDTIVNRPLAFPLSIGKTWTIEYTEAHPNRQHSSEHLTSIYRVTGWEDVTVPAGTFHALKVEEDGTWTATIAPAVSAVAGSRVDAAGATTVVQTNRAQVGTVSGHTYKAFWYVPSVKKWAKSVEEYYDGNGRRYQRYTSELISYQPAS